MSSLTPAILLIDPDSRYANDDAEALLAGSTEQLARLRFTIILVARWEPSSGVTSQPRKEMRTELTRLRGLYLEWSTNWPWPPASPASHATLF